MDRRESESKGNPLTTALVIAKTKSDSLHNIKNLNVWGNNLDDLKLIREMPSLEVLSLSVNKISSMKDFSYCPKLRQLFLRKNNIYDIKQIRYLMNLPLLTQLWLHDNPCANIENYRETVIKALPKLQKLDNIDITNEERIRAQQGKYGLDIISNTPQEEYVSNKSLRMQENNQQGVGYGARVSREQKTRDRKQQEQQPSQKYYHRDSRQSESNKYVHQQKAPNFGKGQQRVSKQQVVGRWDRQSNEQASSKRNESSSRNKHILLAVVSLLKQLDQQSLQIVRVEVDKLLEQ